MTIQIDPAEFRLPGGVRPRIGRFYALWLEKGQGQLPAVSQFDLAALSANYPLLARIGLDASGKTLMWREVASTVQWPFKAPVPDGPLIVSVPQPSVKRVVAGFTHTLTSGIPDYHETTCWVEGDPTSIARLSVPVIGESGRELIASWELL